MTDFTTLDILTWDLQRLTQNQIAYLHHLKNRAMVNRLRNYLKTKQEESQ